MDRISQSPAWCNSGILIPSTVISAWRHHRREPEILWSTAAALLLTGFQGWLGGRVVASQLAPWIVTVHLMFGLAIVQLLLFVTVRASGRIGGRPSQASVVLVLLTIIQIGIGTQVRGAIDNVIGNGTAPRNALASIGLVDHLHRNASLIVFAGSLLMVMWFWITSPGNRIALRWASVAAVLATLQVALGISMAYLSLEPIAQVAHLTVASLLLGAETVLLLLSGRSALRAKESIVV